MNGSLLPEFSKDTSLEQITTERIERFRERLLDEGQLSRRSVQKVLVLLFGVLKRAKRRKWIDSNPAEDVERVTVKRSGDFNVLSPVEVAAGESTRPKTMNAHTAAAPAVSIRSRVAGPRP